jgi:formate dehydrogenase subunit gamma
MVDHRGEPLGERQEEQHGVRVRGRDFTGYRIGGAVAALLFGAALVWQAVYLLQGYDVVVPEVAWVAGSGAGGGADRRPSGVGDPSRVMASEVLTQRTALLRERLVTGPAPDEAPPPRAVGREEYLGEQPMDVADGTFPLAWATPDAETLAMMRGREKLIGFTAVPYPSADIFERPDGRIWRRGMADWATHLGALAILGTGFLLSAVLAIRGRVPILDGTDGRTVKRFAFVERATHWMTAGSFVMLALTGLVIAFGTTLIGPVFGEAVLGDLGWLSTWGHMMFAPPFFLGIVGMAVMWLLRNLPEPALDIPWLVRLGGFLTDRHDNPPARKFNAGQKVTFWVAITGGLLMTVSGVLLMFPFYVLGVDGLIWALLAHAVIGVLLIAFFIGHAYIGSVGMQDAISAMWGGKVDLNWAREHHALWLDELAQKGQLPHDADADSAAALRRHRPGPRRATAPVRKREV